jgi:hypothetical protein
MQSEGKKPLRAIADEAFLVKLGPRPAFPPDPVETGQVKPAAPCGQDRERAKCQSDNI